MKAETVFITGGTGYVGSRLIPLLVAKGYPVRALVRPGSESKLPGQCTAIPGNALLADTFADQIAPATIFIQLIGTPHPSPAKAKQFREVDLVSMRASVAAATQAGIGHFIYVSVAHPAPVMREYIAVRQEGEAMLGSSGIPATVLRPWYILGPGHRWPYALLPMYWLCGLVPAWREGAQRLGLITLRQMLAALVQAVVQPPVSGTRIWETPQIRSASR